MPGSANLINEHCNLTVLNESYTNSVFVNNMGALTGAASSSDDDESSSDSGSGSFTGFNFLSFFPLGTTGTTSFFDCRERQAKGMHKKLVNRTPLTTSAIIGGPPLSLTLRYRPAHISLLIRQMGLLFWGQTQVATLSPRVTLCHIKGSTIAHSANKPIITSCDITTPPLCVLNHQGYRCCMLPAQGEATWRTLIVSKSTGLDFSISQSTTDWL
mgnify:CR=1 FL=1